MKEIPFDVVVVANHHRKALILDYLEDIPYKVIYTPDFELPSDWIPVFKQYVRHMRGHTGQHRCLEGHKIAINTSTKDHILLLEDDAVPNCQDWFERILDAFNLLNQFEVVSIHSREPEYRNFFKITYTNKYRFDLFFGKNGVTRWALGTLGYFMRRDVSSKLLEHNYNGLPIDIFICNNFDFCFIEPSPLDHDRSQGSLIDY